MAKDYVEANKGQISTTSVLGEVAVLKLRLRDKG
jgi:hypothetical protein